MKYLLFLFIPLIIGCQERYRYPCQDPKNWEEQFCKKPFCSANGTCPEDLRHYEKPKNLENGNGKYQNSCSGSCK